MYVEVLKKTSILYQVEKEKDDEVLRKIEELELPRSGSFGQSRSMSGAQQLQ